MEPRPSRPASTSLAATLSLIVTTGAMGQGHGPVFGLSTPTLGRGGWSLDFTAMGRNTTTGALAMLRPMLSYGLTEDVQLSLSVPVPLYRADGVLPVRAATRMPANRDLEATLAYRFHRRGVGVGSRFETTAFAAVAFPSQSRRGALDATPGGVAALVTGYASRTLYAWAGGLYRHYLPSVDPLASSAGDLAMYSLVVGYRPPHFQPGSCNWVQNVVVRTAER